MLLTERTMYRVLNLVNGFRGIKKRNENWAAMLVINYGLTKSINTRLLSVYS